MSDTIRNYLVQKTQTFIRLTFMAVLTGSLLACGTLSNAQNTVSTVNEAVALLQELDKNGTWERVSKGLDALKDQKQGYTATLSLKEGQVSSAGNFQDPLKINITLDVQMDAAGNARLGVVQNNQSGEYFIEGFRGSPKNMRMYQITNGNYSCMKNGDVYQLLSGGLSGIFQQYAFLAAGSQLLSVAQEKGDAVIAGRDVTHYELESKVPDAVKVLEKIKNQELQQKVSAAGHFTLAGSLDIDQKMDGLLRFQSTYSDLDHQSRSEFVFEITRWGSVPDLPLPTADQIVNACK